MDVVDTTNNPKADPYLTESQIEMKGTADETMSEGTKVAEPKSSTCAPLMKFLGCGGAAKTCATGDIMSALHPAVKKIKSKRIAITFGVIILLINIVAFATFLGISFSSKLKAKFLSLEKGAGVCESITLSTTDMLLLDKNGNWETSAAFQVQEALFGVSFSAYRADGSSWKKDMDMLNTAIQAEMDVLRASSDLATKILHLFSWRKTITATKAGTIRVWFNAAPSYTFNTPAAQLDSLFGEYAQSCANNDGWSINADGILTTTFNNVWDGNSKDANDEAVISWTCTGFQITDVGFDTKYPTESFNFDIDLRTAATVASLNAKIMSTNDLLTVTDIFYQFANDDAPETIPDFDVMFDPKFPNMKAVYQDTAGVYLARFGYTVWNVEFSGSYYNWVLDVTDTTTNSWVTPSYTGPYACPSTCDTSAKQCNSPDFVFSFTKYGDAAQSFKLHLYADELFTINLENMDPGKIGCATSKTLGSAGVLGQLEPTSTSAFETNLDAKPFKLTEAYFECVQEPTSAFFDALGIAQGNAALFVTISVLFIMFLANKVPGLVATMVSSDEIADNNQHFAEALKMIARGKPDELTDAHKELQALLKAFLSTDLTIRT
mmetsp:Transcript_34091/g.62334  ORF Transcript_34091/g.62334 Transcript_34091/m.62334 type:complete len:607 (-) Transcript_34091:350-2170(-)